MESGHHGQDRLHQGRLKQRQIVWITKCKEHYQGISQVVVTILMSQHHSCNLEASLPKTGVMKSLQRFIHGQKAITLLSYSAQFTQQFLEATNQRLRRNIALQHLKCLEGSILYFAYSSCRHDRKELWSNLKIPLDNFLQGERNQFLPEMEDDLNTAGFRKLRDNFL